MKSAISAPLGASKACSRLQPVAPPTTNASNPRAFCSLVCPSQKLVEVVGGILSTLGTGHIGSRSVVCDALSVPLHPFSLRHPIALPALQACIERQRPGSSSAAHPPRSRNPSPQSGNRLPNLHRRLWMQISIARGILAGRSRPLLYIGSNTAAVTRIAAVAELLVKRCSFRIALLRIECIGCRPSA